MTSTGVDMNLYPSNGSLLAMTIKSATGNVGIGSTSPVTTLDVKGHINLGASAPTVSTCGSGTLVSGSSDNKFTITGITAATACTITFSSALPTAPVCSFNTSTGISVGGIPTTTGVTTTMVALTGTLQGLCF